MACVECDPGVWICDDGPDPPDCMFEDIPALSVYVGRFHLANGQWNVWRRANNVSVSENAPASGGAPWSMFGSVQLSVSDDYDIWIKPGGPNNTKIKIAQV